MSPRRRLPPLVPALMVLALLGPVAVGLWCTILPAFGMLPGAEGDGLSLAAFGRLFDWRGLPGAVWLSAFTGIISTAGALLVATLVLAGWTGTRTFALLQRTLSPLLALPHAAAAFGLAFLIAPSGWIARALSPWLTGWDKPPDLLIPQDPWGIALILGLIAKEAPFLLLMSLAALPQAQPAQSRLVSTALGYGRVTGFLKAVYPRLYAQIRLPVYVTLAYSMSTVDVAMILGPNTPPTLSVQIVRWMADPDLTYRLQAAAAALLQLALVVAAIGLWRVGELVAAMIWQRWVEAGTRGRFDAPLRGLGLILGTSAALAVILGLISLLVWSFAARWSFPSALPEAPTLISWMRHGPEALHTLGSTVLIAGTATLIALALTIACLEAEHRNEVRMGRSIVILYLPLLIPQTAFLPGLQIMLLNLSLDRGLLPVIAAHLVFVLPYVYLSLQTPFHAWDTRQATVAAALGAGPGRILWRVRLPMLLRSVLTAGAVGFAVSVGQYLPTLLTGGGRVQTLTTEAVALSSGGDRRAIGVWGLMQTLAAFLPFALALGLPAIVWRNRRGLADV
ncbi:ABC transporter permease [Pelagovum pacificum]|uniref:ABC transporter permease subunit n=1 Tax=Pelagovum pacificum TaxID=2588711 RepID=A0A5C5GH53_9RHOB|nr:ABC transporter permease subunit [Pelagovum pacificum]QQA42828.1 ABC transporter permease subunit [Pelagovum pacificum]TNY34023.1 ABC transporter permease subunit [Pelagovum pacificum]